jgi:hypothetical protein
VAANGTRPAKASWERSWRFFSLAVSLRQKATKKLHESYKQAYIDFAKVDGKMADTDGKSF